MSTCRLQHVAASCDEICASWFSAPHGVAYVPTLGPIHPQEDPAGLIADVLSVAGTGRVLPYDKDARWLQDPDVVEGKDEHVVPGTAARGVAGEPGAWMVVPTLARRPGPRITLYCYGTPGLAVMADLAEELTVAHGDARVQVVHLGSGATESVGAGAGQTVRIWLHELTGITGTSPEPADLLRATDFSGVYVLGECCGPVVASFADFAQRMRDDGWEFLCQHARQRELGPVLIRMHEERVVGATGPYRSSPTRSGAAVCCRSTWASYPRPAVTGMGATCAMQSGRGLCATARTTSSCRP